MSIKVNKLMLLRLRITFTMSLSAKRPIMMLSLVSSLCCALLYTDDVYLTLANICL